MLWKEVLMIWQDYARQLKDVLGLDGSPVAVTFSNTPASNGKATVQYLGENTAVDLNPSSQVTFSQNNSCSGIHFDPGNSCSRIHLIRAAAYILKIDFGPPTGWGPSRMRNTVTA